MLSILLGRREKEKRGRFLSLVALKPQVVEASDYRRKFISNRPEGFKDVEC